MSAILRKGCHCERNERKKAKRSVAFFRECSEAILQSVNPLCSSIVGLLTSTSSATIKNARS
ncbi:MAG: hypothetical protein ACKVTZ_19140 [Bacteroidia bacterium]